ncbi:MAG: HNH endonuclease [Nitrososphaera sp.]|nr:HNH endonuclease [Nitrososphaera sp.]MCI0648282.1 HNH endonuclease [Chloroflexota bacterium]
MPSNPSSPGTQTVEALALFPFCCPNCDSLVNKAALFCSDLCRDEAKFVRYFRACLNDGRYNEPDVQEALRIRLALILGGGYAERARRLSQTIRDAVIARDGGRCRKCGKPGNQIDHIHGSSSDLDNLQLLCEWCHNKKTTTGFVKISAETHPEEWVKREALLARIHAARPIRLCDSMEWEQLWQVLLKARRKALKGG